MVKYIIKSTLLVLICLAFTGCEEANKTSENDMVLDIAESKYDSYELRKARDEAKIKMLNNLADREKAEHNMLLYAAQNNIRIVDGSEDVVTAANYKAAEYLIKELPRNMRKQSSFLVTNFVNVDLLIESSTLGRMVSEQISSRLKQLGYTTIDIKFDIATFTKEKSGELSLNREISKISTKHNIPAVVVGTYAIATDRVYLTTRIINVADSTILASYDYNIPMTRDVCKMVLQGRILP